jgi:hypothetical protein
MAYRGRDKQSCNTCNAFLTSSGWFTKDASLAVLFGGRSTFHNFSVSRTLAPGMPAAKNSANSRKFRFGTFTDHGTSTEKNSALSYPLSASKTSAGFESPHFGSASDRSREVIGRSLLISHERYALKLDLPRRYECRRASHLFPPDCPPDPVSSRRGPREYPVPS